MMNKIALWCGLLLCMPVFGQGNGYLPAGQGKTIVEHTYYTLSYRAEYGQAEWVAYTLSSDMLTKNAERGDNFRADPSVPGGSASPADYAKTGYDKGHLCPAADMAFSEEAMSETFFMSNMSPQAPKLNRLAWRFLEDSVRAIAAREKELFITVGGVLKPGLRYLGKKTKVAVPKQYYKALLVYNNGKAKGIAFLMPNAVCTKPLAEYAVSIDSVEAVTGLDLYPQLPDEIEQSIESGFDLHDWGFAAEAKLPQKRKKK